MFYVCMGCGFLGFEYINRLHVDIFVVTSSVVSIYLQNYCFHHVCLLAKYQNTMYISKTLRHCIYLNDFNFLTAN